MAPRVLDLQTQISTLTQELELSTFLNKGILTTNSEHKVRIAELETENAALRAAERRLTATEDALEEAEKKCRAHERERILWEREVEKERQGRVGVEKELEEVKGRLEDLEAYWRGMRDGFDARLRHEEKRGESSTTRTGGAKGAKGDGAGKDNGAAVSGPACWRRIESFG
jgi:DNA repair exonuclease SbcCD ATPase subunit